LALLSCEGSFDFVVDSLREATTSLRMTVSLRIYS
jgi:hypothetical protein